jgi:hypothetical protein
MPYAIVDPEVLEDALELHKMLIKKKVRGVVTGYITNDLGSDPDDPGTWIVKVTFPKVPESIWMNDKVGVDISGEVYRTIFFPEELLVVNHPNPLSPA